MNRILPSEDGRERRRDMTFQRLLSSMSDGVFHSQDCLCKIQSLCLVAVVLCSSLGSPTGELENCSWPCSLQIGPAASKLQSLSGSPGFPVS